MTNGKQVSDSAVRVQIIPARIPRYVQRLNAFAADRGVTVETVVAPYDDDPEVRLWSNWRTTRERFSSLGLLSRGQPMPSKRGVVSIPGWQYLQPQRALMKGEMTSSGDDVLWEIDWGLGAFTIEEAGEVEIVTDASVTLYHGTADALLAHGIGRERLPLDKKPSKSSSGFYAEGLHWWSRRQLDDTIVLRIESQAAYLERQAERRRLEALMRSSQKLHRRPGDSIFPHPSAAEQESRVERTRPAYLRLVVDNDRAGTVTNSPRLEVVRE